MKLQINNLKPFSDTYVCVSFFRIFNEIDSVPKTSWKVSNPEYIVKSLIWYMIIWWNLTLISLFYTLFCDTAHMIKLEIMTAIL